MKSQIDVEKLNKLWEAKRAVGGCTIEDETRMHDSVIITVKFTCDSEEALKILYPK